MPNARGFSASGYEEWLFITWVFGFSETYEPLSRYLVSTAATDHAAACLNQDGITLGGNVPGAVGKW